MVGDDQSVCRDERRAASSQRDDRPHGLAGQVGEGLRIAVEAQRAERSASGGICCGIHMPSSAQAMPKNATTETNERTRRDGFSRVPPREMAAQTSNYAPEFGGIWPSSILEAPKMNLPRSLTAALDELLTGPSRRRVRTSRRSRSSGPAARVGARMVCRERAVVSGAAFLPRLFAFLSPPARVALRVTDGDLVEPGAVLAEIEGPAITVLAAERTALNLVQRLTGIATMTRAYVDALKGYEGGPSRHEEKQHPHGASSSGTPCVAAGARITVPAFRAVFSSRTTTRMAPARRGKPLGAPGDFRELNRRLQRPPSGGGGAHPRRGASSARRRSGARAPGQHDDGRDSEGRRGRPSLQRGDGARRHDRSLGPHDARDGPCRRGSRSRLRVGRRAHALGQSDRHRAGPRPPGVEPFPARLKRPALISRGAQDPSRAFSEFRKTKFRIRRTERETLPVASAHARPRARNGHRGPDGRAHARPTRRQRPSSSRRRRSRRTATRHGRRAASSTSARRTPRALS